MAERTHTLHVCFLWHMHQPPYRDPNGGQVAMPWVRLHAAKDYTDMAHICAQVPEARVTFNWVPGLLDQLEAYADPDYPGDVFEALATTPAEQLDEAQRRQVSRYFARLEGPMAERWPRFNRVAMRARTGAELGPAALRELQLGYNLAWCGDALLEDPQLVELAQRLRGGAPIRDEDTRTVIAAQREAASRVTGRYRELAATGRVELTCSPYYHPILPLLIDTDSARAADPTSPLPEGRFRFPGDASAQLQLAHRRHAERFGVAPRGLWPSEGAVSDLAIELAERAGFAWFVSDEALLHKSQHTQGHRAGPWSVRSMAAFLRDHELSDLIGFVYARTPLEEACADFVDRLQRIRGSLGGGNGVCTIALDGENCWGSYPEGACGFLPALYRAIDRAPGLKLSTFSEALEDVGTGPRQITRLGTGSWIDGTLRTWLGDPAKNLGWTLLAGARAADPRPMDALLEEAPELAETLLRAEASDWFWWLGEGNTSDDDAEFDRLFRAHLAKAYEQAQRSAPARLGSPLDERIGRFETTLPLQPLRPAITGRADHYYKWVSAGVIREESGAVQRARRRLLQVDYGFDDEGMSLRVHLDHDALGVLAAAYRVVLEAAGARFCLWPRVDAGPGVLPEGSEVACERFLEARLPRAALGFTPDPGAELAFGVRLEALEGEGQALERLPAAGAILVTQRDLDRDNWYV